MTKVTNALSSLLLVVLVLGGAVTGHASNSDPGLETGSGTGAAHPLIQASSMETLPGGGGGGGGEGDPDDYDLMPTKDATECEDSSCRLWIDLLVWSVLLP